MSTIEPATGATVAVPAAAHPRRTAWRELARPVAQLTSANVLDACLALGQGVLVARWLGPRDYGTAALVMAYAGLMFSVVDPRSSDACTKHLGEALAAGDREKAKALCLLGWALDFLSTTLVVVAVAVTAGLAGRHVLQDGALSGLAIVYAAAFVPRSLGGTPVAILTTLRQFTPLAVVQVGQALVRTILVLGLVARGWGITGVVLGTAAVLAAGGVVLGAVGYAVMIRAWGRPHVRRSWQALRGERRSLARFLVYNNANVTLGAIVKQVDVILVGVLRGPAEAGYYRLAKSLGTVPGLLVAPLQATTYPTLAALHARGAAAELARKTREYARTVGLPLAAGIALTVPFVGSVLHVLVGQAYVPATLSGQLIIVGSALWAGGFWMRPLFLARGRVAAYARLYLLSLAPYLAGALLVPRWGAAGMAAGYLGHNLLLFALPALRMVR